MEKYLYISPEIEETEFRADGIICSSPLDNNASNEDFTEDEIVF